MQIVANWFNTPFSPAAPTSARYGMPIPAAGPNAYWLAGSHDASIVLAGEAMATLTIRNVPDKVAKSLKSLARKNRRSMEQEVRELISEHVGERVSVLDQIQAAWGKQTRRPTATEVEGWISAGRE
jgi:plasmid stability protein